MLRLLQIAWCWSRTIEITVIIILLKGDTWNPFPLHIFVFTLFLMVKHNLTSKILGSYYTHFCQRPSPIIPSSTGSSDLERTAAIEILKDASAQHDLRWVILSA